MTNWEKSCVEALVTSSSAFALFKARQRNKRHLDQYLNKIWPYKRELKSKLDKKNPLIDLFRSLIRNQPSAGNPAIGDSLVFDLYSGKYRIKEIINEIDALRILMQERSADTSFVVKQVDLEDINVTFHSERDTEYMWHNTREKIVSQASTMLMSLNDLRGDFIVKITIKITSGNEMNEATQVFYHWIKTMLSYLVKKKKNIGASEYKGLNVGIEIEYEGVWFKKLEREMLNRGAISFNSGMDGGLTRGDRVAYQAAGRLRENRLRLNGLRGLNALDLLLSEMKSSCALSKNSGMHYHIDVRRYIKNGVSTETLKKCMQTQAGEQIRMDSTASKSQTDSWVNIVIEIFGRKSETLSSVDKINFFINAVKACTEFDTMEFRIGTPTFNYKIITIEVLTAIHLVKKNWTDLDIKYLQFLLQLKQAGL